MTTKKKDLALQDPPAPAVRTVEPEPAPAPEVTDAEGFRAVLVAEIRAEYARINGVIRETRDAIGVKQAEHEVKVNRWKTEAEKALQEYRVPPERPEPPDNSREHALLTHLEGVLQEMAEREQKTLGWSRLRIETAWQNARRELAEEAAEALAVLERVQERVRPWHRLVSDSRRADEQSKGSHITNGDADRMKQRVELGDVIDLARGVDPLEPAPRESKIEKIPHDEDAAQMGRLMRQEEYLEGLHARGIVISRERGIFPSGEPGKRVIR